MPKLIIDGQEIEVEAGMTVLQACEQAGAEIPRFCYHEKLSIAGNCRMCLVEMEKSPKPIASCAMPAADNMVIHTNTPLVKKAREGVMEFLLINHPLDCPICDQGGECDLQDQAYAYGRGSNRYEENKRAIKDKYMGPLIKTHMTRCIHCTRCIRFITEIAGVEEIGTIGRGEHMEVTTYVEEALTSELSGNIVDICPVGALTSKPYAFKARSWELTKTETIDVLDAVGSNIRVDSRGMEVMRILPRLNEDVNEEWISDKSRYAYDGLKLQRLDRPMVKKDGKLVPVSWAEALDVVAQKLKLIPGHKMAALVGDLADCESITALKDLMQAVKCHNIDCRTDGAEIDATNRASYLFNTTIAAIEEADLCLLVGTNPRLEATMVNARLRKRYLAGHFHIARLGNHTDLTYKVEELGDDIQVLKAIADDSHPFAQKLKAAKKPMIILGSYILTRPDANAIMALCNQICQNSNVVRSDWNGFNILHKAASRVGGLDLKFVPNSEGKNTMEILKATTSGEIELVYLLGADEIDTSRLGDSFVIYQGHHGDRGAHRADVILPGAAYTEKNATYVNTEGRVQRTRAAVSPPGEAIDDWNIIYNIATSLNINLGYDNLQSIRARMVELAPHFAHLEHITQAQWQKIGKDGALASDKVHVMIENYYMTDPISRASKIMAECSKTKRASNG